MILAIYICSLLLRSGCLGANPTIGDQNLDYVTLLSVHILRLCADRDDSLANGVLGPRFLAIIIIIAIDISNNRGSASTFQLVLLLWLPFSRIGSTVPQGKLHHQNADQVKARQKANLLLVAFWRN